LDPRCTAHEHSHVPSRRASRVTLPECHAWGAAQAAVLFSLLRPAVRREWAATAGGRDCRRAEVGVRNANPVENENEATGTGERREGKAARAARERALEGIGRGGREKAGVDRAPKEREGGECAPTQADVRPPGLPCLMNANSAERNSELPRLSLKKMPGIGRSGRS
jgi:hypothetical protein